MKNLVTGIILGVALCVAAVYLIYPKLKQAAYDTGYNEGIKRGMATGTTEGIAQGVAQVKTEQQRVLDSAAYAQQKLEEKQKKAIKPKKQPAPVQNWHVVDGKIAEPVITEEK